MKLTAVVKTNGVTYLEAKKENSSTLFPRKETKKKKRKANTDVKNKEEEAKDTKPKFF